MNRSFVSSFAHIDLVKRFGRVRALALTTLALCGFLACSDGKPGSSEEVATARAALSGTTDPVVRYWFNEASGTQASDSSGNNHPATLQNGAGFVAGARGNAVRIAGGTQRVALPAGVVEACEDVTIAARVKLTTNSANWARIFDFGSNANSYMFLTPRAGASNILRFGITTGGGAAEQRLSYTYSFPTNTWKHVAVVLSGNVGTLYLDGVQVAQNTNMTLNPWELGATVNNWLGDSQFAADPTLDGTVDDVVVSCRAYSASEVSWLSNGTDPVAQYSFNEASGTTAADSSGNARNATLVNGASFVSGLNGNAVRIAGGTQRVNIPTGVVQSCADLTIAAHVRLATNATNWAHVFDFGANTTSYMFLTPRAGAANILRFAITTGGNAAEQRLSYTYSFPTNTWKHVAVVLSGNTGTMYLDGVQVAQNTNLTLNPSALGATVNNWLGDSQFTADPTLDGTVDNLLISCRAFSPTEIGSLAGTCTTNANCADANPCTTDACSAGFCTHSTAANGTSCPDGNLCNGGETCQSGSCAAGTPPVVDDGNACTTDSCDPVQGVTHTPITGGGCGSGGAGGAAGGGGRGGAGGASGSGGGGGASGGGGVSCPSGTSPLEMFIELPPGTSRATIALGSYGLTPLEVHDRVRVITPSGGFASVSSLSGNPGIPTRLGVESHVQDLFGEPNIELRDRSRVHGNAVSPGAVTLFPGAVVDGQTLQQALTPRRRESWVICHPNTHQGNIDLQPGQVFPTGTRLAPGAWGTLAVKSGARIRLRGGTTYFFESIAIEPSAIVDLDTAAGGVQLYFRNGGFFRGVQERTDTRANVLFGAENGSFTINGSFRGTVVAPRGLVDLPTTAGGHRGSFFGNLVIAHQSTDITSEPVDTTGMCPPGVCNGLCPCDDGGTGCQTQDDCTGELVCLRNTCVVPDCLFSPVIHGCGFVGAKCGAKCTDNPTCTSDQNCPAGLVCPEGNGWKYGVPGQRVCERPDCDPSMCGSITSECGLCDCVANCGAKSCGDANLSDGCGGRCPAVCGDGQSGCQQDSDCHAGSVCLSGICRPADPCSSPDLAPPNCGPGSLCGPCAVSPVTSCADRECGTSNGTSCGQCTAGFFCNGAGQCALLEPTPSIQVPVPGGDSRTVTPPATPAAPFVGAIPAEFTVTDRGSAQYTIPIETPPGRSIEPELELRYTSSTGNGALGVGWSLDGFSNITRCQRTFAQDGYPQPVTGTTKDAICLDGQRLVVVQGQEWGNNSEYRTAVDTFDKITYTFGDPNPYFVVHKRDGRIFTYGARETSKSFAWPLTRIEDRSGNFLRITYRSPVFNATNLALQLIEDVTAQERVPASITYTGFGSTDGDREIIFAYSQNRADKIIGRRPGGGFLSRILRLDAIDVRAQNQLVRRYSLSYETHNSSSFLTSVQECAGSAAQFCGQGATGIPGTKPPTTFKYFDELGFEAGEVVTFPPSDPNGFPLPEILPYGIVHKKEPGVDDLTTLNVTSDVQLITPLPGGTDLALNVVPVAGPFMSRVAALIDALGTRSETSYLYRTRTFGFPTTNASSGAVAAPCDSGRSAPLQQILYDQTLGSERIHSTCLTKKQTGRKCSPSSLGQGVQCGDVGLAPQLVTYYPREWFVDVDGDGVQDRLSCLSDGQTLRLTYARPFAPSSSPPPLDPVFPAFGGLCDVDCQDKNDPSCSEHRPVSMVLDVDGDGTGNLVVFDDDEAQWAALTFVNGAALWRDDWFASVSFRPRKYYTVAIDANGDGLRDILGLPDSQYSFDPTSDSTVAEHPTILLLNTGKGFVERRLVADGSIAEAPKFPAFVIDYDHDGIEELMESVSERAGPGDPLPTWRLRKIRGGRILSERIPSLAAGPGVLGDFDGDGDIDAITRGKTVSGPGGPGFETRRPFTRHLGRDHRHGLLQTVTDGLGRQVDVDYTRTAPQGTDRGCAWPHRCVIKLEVAAVKTHTASHFLNQARNQRAVDRVYSYTYNGGLADMAGYGWLGFRERDITVTDSQGAILDHTTITHKNPPAWIPVDFFSPYTYVTAGRVEAIQSDSPLIGSGIGFAESRISRTTFEWGERPSAFGRPFAFLSSKRSVVSAFFPTGLNQRLHEAVVSFEPDAFGNVVNQSATAHDLDGSATGIVPGSETVTTVHRTFDPTFAEIDDWLISRPKAVDVTNTPRCSLPAECTAKTKSRRSETIYYPGTTLTRFVFRELGTADLERSTELVRDAQGNVREVIAVDVVGDLRHGTIDYDERGVFPISMSRTGEGKTLTAQVRYDDRFGLVVASADPNGIDATWSYDDFGVLRHYRGPSGERQVDYVGADLYLTSNGQPVQAAYRVTSTEAGGESTDEEYNSLGQLVRRKSSALDGVPVFEEFGYDFRQLLRSQSRPHLDGDLSEGFVEYSYDARNRLILESFPDGGEITHDYASAIALSSSHPSWIVPGATHVVRTQVKVSATQRNSTVQVTDRDGLPVNIVDALDQTTRYFYAAFGAIERVVDPAGRAIDVTHDAYGRVRTVTDAARGGTETTLYNGLDEVIETRDAADRISSLRYDDFGRLQQLADADGITSWLYDGTGPNEIGRLVETISPTNQSTRYGYEAPTASRNRGLMNRVTQQLFPASGDPHDIRELTTGYIFDDFSRLERIDYPAAFGQFSIHYDFDAAGHTIKASDALTPTNVHWQLLEAEQGYRIKKERLGNAACGNRQGTTTERSYDRLTGRLNNIRTTCGTGLLQDLAYEYDLAGNMTLRADVINLDTKPPEIFGYDPLNRLTTINGVTTYTYDNPQGRLHSQTGIGTYAYESQGRDWLATAGAYSYQHDAVGNVTDRSGSQVPGGTQHIDYTAFDLPSRITSGGSGGQATDFGYDASGERVLKQTATAATFYAGALYQRTEHSGGGVDDRFMIYAGGRAVAQATTTAAGPGSGAPTVTYLYDDALGSVQTVMNASASVQQVRDYAPFGALRSATGGGTSVPYGFTGHEDDTETGLVNMKGRIYDQAVGQFMQADPIVQEPFSQGLNRFAYVNNSPLNFVDPSGLGYTDVTWSNPNAREVTFDDDPLVGLAGLAASPLLGEGSGAGGAIGTASTAGGLASNVSSGVNAVQFGQSAGQQATSFVGSVVSSIRGLAAASQAGSPPTTTTAKISGSSVSSNAATPGKPLGSAVAPVQELSGSAGQGRRPLGCDPQGVFGPFCGDPQRATTEELREYLIANRLAYEPGPAKGGGNIIEQTARTGHEIGRAVTVDGSAYTPRQALEGTAKDSPFRWPSNKQLAFNTHSHPDLGRGSEEPSTKDLKEAIRLGVRFHVTSLRSKEIVVYDPNVGGLGKVTAYPLLPPEFFGRVVQDLPQLLGGP